MWIDSLEKQKQTRSTTKDAEVVRINNQTDIQTSATDTKSKEKTTSSS
jgi:hypothetical protein